MTMALQEQQAVENLLPQQEHRYRDNYQKSFENQIEFIQFLDEMELDASWTEWAAREIRVIGMDRTIAVSSSQPNDKELLKDTMRNTQMAVEIGGSLFYLRDTAMKTLFDRAEISGRALQKLKKETLAEIINECLAVNTGNALIRFSHGKVSALHSGNNSYSVLPIPALFRVVTDRLEKDFTDYKFVLGTYEHKMTTGLWDLGENEALTQIYREFLEKHGANDIVKIRPKLRLSSSDVAVNTAQLWPSLEIGGMDVALGTPLKLKHRRTSVDQFAALAREIFSQYQNSMKALDRLMGILIRYPFNCMSEVMAHLNIPKKYAAEALDYFKRTYLTSRCSAYEIYFAICYVLYLLKSENVPGSYIAKMEETIGRALSLNWTNYDYPAKSK